jgi:TatD DNase family protein
MTLDPIFVDSHAHLDDARFAADREQVIQRAWDAGLQTILTIGNGSGPDDMGCGIPIAETYPHIVTSAGVHPHDAARFEQRHEDMLRSFAAHPKVVAIGETGLDYHYDNSPRDVQRRVFTRQLELAGELDLPVIIHTREADGETQEILRQTGIRRGVLHCFTSGAALADFALSLDFMISFSGIVTFPRSEALARIAAKVPADRLLVETDCPYLAPVPHRGKRNEPGFVVETARWLADLREIPVAELAQATTDNFHRMFSTGQNVVESGRQEVF